MIDKVKKRDGRLIPFNPEKITRAIFLAASEVANKEGITADYQIASELTEEVRKLLNRKFAGKIPSVEDIQDAVIKVLIETGHAKTSETYILYRAERSRIRNSRSRLMKTIEDITFLDANESDIKRENANINGNTAMGTMLQYGSAVSKEFCKDFIIKNIPNLKVVKAEATYLLWIDISSLGLNSKEFTKKLKELGNVRVISGVTFGENGDNFIRVNIATPLEILKEALFSIKKTIESF